jgi:hypothetical protein
MKPAQQQDISLLNINLSNARAENESYEDYRIRQATNKKILTTYETVGREGFRKMFPEGVASAMQQAADEQHQDVAAVAETVTETVQVPGSLHLEDE